MYDLPEMEDYTELSYQTPLFSIRAHGKWRDQVVFEVCHGKQYHRVLTAYDRSPKTHLVPYQPAFAAAVRSWQGQTPDVRRWYHSRAAKLGLRITGFNYWISLSLKGKLEGAERLRVK